MLVCVFDDEGPQTQWGDEKWPRSALILWTGKILL